MKTPTTTQELLETYRACDREARQPMAWKARAQAKAAASAAWKAYRESVARDEKAAAEPGEG